MSDVNYEELIGQAKENIWMSHAQFKGRDDPSPLGLITGGDGCYLIDHKGNRYLDATGGSHCCAIGHCDQSNRF